MEIRQETPGDYEAFMALRLNDSAPRLDGVVRYDRAFGLEG